MKIPSVVPTILSEYVHSVMADRSLLHRKRERENLKVQTCRLWVCGKRGL